VARQRTEPVGLRAELNALREDSTLPGLTVVRGGPGSGKTTLLVQASREWRDAGFVVLEVTQTEEGPEWDLFGVRALLGAIREQFEQIGALPRLVESIDLVSRLCTASSYASLNQRSSLAGALGTLFARIRGRRPLVVVVDDAGRIPQPVFGLAAVRQAGHHVVASCTTTEAPAAGTDLGALADRLVDLGPLADEDVAGLLKRVSHEPVDDAAQHALQESLGPLYRNPGTVLSTVAELRRRGRLVPLGGHLCLRDAGAPIGLPPGHRLLTAVENHGELGRDLVILSASGAGFAVDDVPVLADATGRPALEIGRTIDALAHAGVLDSDGSGRLNCCCPALGTAVVEQAGKGVVRGLHRAMADQLLDTARYGGRDRSALAGHVAAAGRSLRPRPELVALLDDDETRVVPLDPARHLEYRYAAWWHSQAGATRPGLQSEVVRLLVHAAEYRRLGAFVAEVVDRAGPAATYADRERAELPAAAALAAIHCGQPVPAPVRDALVRAGGATAPLELADAWFAGEPVVPERVAAAFAPAWPRHWASPPVLDGRIRRAKPSAAQVAAACGHRDLVPVFESVLGSGYRAPADGPVGVHHRVFRGYTDGDWASALSAVRELELTPGADEPALRCAHLLAAEMCGWRGEDRQARKWLDAVPEDGGFPALRAWVSIGLRQHTGDGEGALEEGWRSYHEHLGDADEPGAARLLERLASIATEAGRGHAAQRVLAEVEARYDPRGRDRAAESALLVRGLVTADLVALRAAERLVRERGDRLDLVLACRLVGRIAAEPHPWLEEAYRLANAIGATRLTAGAKYGMKRGGVAPLPRRDRRPELSGLDLRIIELIRQGKTNRQIALALRVSAKTVEKHLTRLFAKAGCRTRHGLATSDLGGTPESIGA
jgi:DNA-binding CsgD family transcriptional regulator